MSGAYQGRVGGPQHERDEAADAREMSERVAAVVRAFHALREGRPLPDPLPTIAPLARSPGVAQPPPGAPAGPPLPRRVRGPAAARPIGRAPGAQAPAIGGNRGALDVASPANRNGIPPDVASPGASGGRVSATGGAAVANRERPESAAPDRRPAERTAAVSALDGALLDLIALAVAVGAFIAPWVWLVTVAAATAAGTAAAALTRNGPDLRTLARQARRRVVAWLRPRSLVWLPVLMSRVLILSILLPFAVGAGRWLVEHGSEGAVAAGRAAAWHHGFRVAAAGVCFLLVAGSGTAHDRRVLALRRRLQPLGTAGVASLVVVAVALVLWVPLLGPRVGAGRAGGADGLAWVPPSLRDEVDRVRDAVVRAELQAATVCLSERQDVRWDSTYTNGNPLEERDVATLRTEQADPAAGEVSTAIVAVHNQLAPWVEDIEVVTGERSVARVERSSLPTAGPAADAPVGAGSDLLRDGIAGFDRGVALRCSAGAVL